MDDQKKQNGSVKLSAAAAAAMKTAVPVTAGKSGGDILPLKRLVPRNIEKVTTALNLICTKLQLTWDGKFLNSEDQISVILADKDGNGDLYKVWTIGQPVGYYVLPVTPGAFTCPVFDTNAAARGTVSRKA